MALTRVSRHIIDEPLELQNINATGIGTFASLRVTGDLQVDGTTTTLDTVVTEVDRLEVSANNSTVGAAITQSGTGDIFNLYDGSTEVFTVTDGGKVGVGEDNVQAHFHVAKNIADSDAINWTGSQLSVATPIAGNNTANRATIYFAPYGSDNNYAPSAISASAGTNGASTLKFFTNPSGNLTGQVQNYERLRITSDGVTQITKGTSGGATANTDAALILDNSSHTYVQFRTPSDKEQGILFGDVQDNNVGSITYSHSSNALSFTTNANERLRITSDGKVRVPDGGKFTCGASDDLEVYHNGNDSAINDKGTGNFYIQGSSNIYIRDYDTSESHIIMTKNGSVQLYHDGNNRLETTNTGVTVTGNINPTGYIQIDDSSSGGNLYIGDSSDLKLFHNGTNSYIRSGASNAPILFDNNSGVLGAKFVPAGAFELYHNGNKKFETTTNGISVTGQIDIGTTSIYGTGDISMGDSDQLRLGGGDDLRIYHDGSINRIRSDVLTVIEKNDSEDMASFMPDGAVVLFNNGSQKFETTTTGAKVTGALEVTQEYPSIRPTLDLNFAATKTLDRRITFTRDSVGTYTDDMGIVKYASNNVPRFDHDPTTGESLGLLIEESRTNRLPNSENFSSFNPNYSSARSTIASTTELAPDGTNTATKLVRTSGQGTGEVAILISGISGVTSGNTYTSSLFVKYLSGSNSSVVSFNNVDSSSGESDSEFNLLTGAIVSDGNQHTTSIIPYGNGWYRIILSNRTASTNGAYFWIRSYNQQEGSGGFLLWGAQVEQGSFATSYIPTSGSTVTRAQDFATITGTNFTDFYNDTEGSLYSDFSLIGLDSAYNSTTVMFTNNTTTNYLAIFGHNPVIPYAITGGSQQFSASLGGSSTTDVNYRAAMAYKLNDFAASLNGGTVSTDTSATIPPADRMLIGRRVTLNKTMNGYIRAIKYYNKRLPNAQLQGLTQQ